MKKIFFIALIFMINFSSTSAEHAKADEYRKILSSGNFYVEYEDKNIKKIVAEENEMRMSRTDLIGRYRAIISVLNPLGSLFSSDNKKYPEYIHHKKKYYRFYDDDYAIMIQEENINDENLNPDEEWSAINKFLSLPDEIAIFNWNDKYHKASPYLSEPIFSESLQKNLNGKIFYCDRYISKIKNKNAFINFDICYENDEIFSVQSTFFLNGKEYPINNLSIKKFSAGVPKNSIKLNLKANIYAAGIGDMNDLLENPVFVGVLQDVMK